jgi:hypothetical protein
MLIVVENSHHKMNGTEQQNYQTTTPENQKANCNPSATPKTLRCLLRAHGNVQANDQAQPQPPAAD